MSYDRRAANDESQLRKAIIRLAHENPDGIRRHLMPLLKWASPVEFQGSNPKKGTILALWDANRNSASFVVALGERGEVVETWALKDLGDPRMMKILADRGETLGRPLRSFTYTHAYVIDEGKGKLRSPRRTDQLVNAWMKQVGLR